LRGSGIVFFSAIVGKNSLTHKYLADHHRRQATIAFSYSSSSRFARDRMGAFGPYVIHLELNNHHGCNRSDPVA